MNKIKTSTFLIMILAIIVSACQKKNFIENLPRCTFNDRSIDYDKILYPFDVDSFTFNIATKIIYKGIVIDTFQVIHDLNDTVYILKIHDSISEINFNRFSKYQEPSTKYSLFEYSITSNLIKYNNSIRIGMKRKELFRNLGIKVSRCDSFMLSGKSYYYYFFIFESNELMKIERKMPTM